MNDIFKMAEQAYHALSIAESELKRLYKENAELKSSLTNVDAVNTCGDETAKREHEPVAFINYNAATGEETINRDCHSELGSTPLYKTPPQREWVGLTDEDIDDLWKTEYFNVHYELPKAIEARLKEKNCG